MEAEALKGKRKRVLFVRLSAIGDVIMTLPVVMAYRKAHPDDFIGYATEPESFPLIAHHPAIDRCIALDFPSWKTHPLSLRSWSDIARQSRSFFHAYDEAISFHALAKATAVSFVAAKRRRGIAPKQRWLQWVFQYAVSKKRTEHYVEFFFRCAGIKQPEILSYGLQPETSARKEFQRWIDNAKGALKEKPLALLCPLASRKWKMLSQDTWREILTVLTPHFFCIVSLNPLPEKEWRSWTSFRHLSKLPSSFTLSHFVAGAATCDFFVGVDSAPSHLAAALQKKGVVVWAEQNSSDPKRVAPYPLDRLKIAKEKESAQVLRGML